MLLRLVVLDAPYYTLKQNSQAKYLFSNILATKIDRYQDDYEGEVTPFDREDMFSTHISLCEEKENGELVPIFTYKFLLVDEFFKRSIDFPIFHWLEDEANDATILENVKSEIELGIKSGKKMGYIGALCINRDYATNRRVMVQMKRFMFVTLQGLYESLNLDEIWITAVLKNNANLLFENAGFQRFSDEVVTASDFDVSAYIERLTDTSEKVKHMFEEHSDIWSRRLEIMRPQSGTHTLQLPA